MFTTGKSGNIKGRPVKKIDSPEAFRTEIHSFLVGQLPQIKRDWKALRPRDRIGFFERLSRYILPSPEIDLNGLSERDLDVLIVRIRTKLNGNGKAGENSENHGAIEEQTEAECIE